LADHDGGRAWMSIAIIRLVRCALTARESYNSSHPQTEGEIGLMKVRLSRLLYFNIEEIKTLFTFINGEYSGGIRPLRQLLAGGLQCLIQFDSWKQLNGSYYVVHQQE
jgi:hypothetical protein